jgi:hypothetical protein
MNIYRQRGQAIIYIIVFVGVLGLAVAYVFNSSQVINNKTQLQNTVDAAAYSVAVVEARDLNFKAYTNRAMVANQVAIAQTVSLLSWIRFLDVSAGNIADATSIIPYVGSVTAAIENIVAGVKDVMEPVLRGAATAIDGVITLLETSQQAMHAATLFVAAETLKEVVKKNDPDVDTSLTLSHAALMSTYVNNHNNFTRRFDPETVRSGSGTNNYHPNKARLDEYRAVTIESTDGFTKNRNDPMPIFPRISTFPVQWDVRRGGGTNMVGEDSDAPYGSWIAMDTLSIHQRTFRCSFSGCRWRSWRETIPIGWGAAKNARGEEDIDFTDFKRAAYYRNSWDVNRNASNIAADEFQDEDEVEMGLDYFGLRSFYDLTLDGLMTKAPGIKIILSKPATSVRTTSEIGTNAGHLDIEEYNGMSGDKLSAFAHATPYYARLNDREEVWRKDQAREYGNLYNPYWQARLEKLSDAEKLQLQTIALNF